MRPYRKERVTKAIQQVIGEAIVHKLNDPRIAPMTTVTRVEMTPDLSIAQVFISVVGNRASESKTLRAVRHASGYLQRLVASAIPLRTCPELRFDMDPRVKGVREMMRLLEKNRRMDPQLSGDDESDVDSDEMSSGVDAEAKNQDTEPPVGDRA